MRASGSREFLLDFCAGFSTPAEGWMSIGVASEAWKLEARELHYDLNDCRSRCEEPGHTHTQALPSLPHDAALFACMRKGDTASCHFPD